ncbi:MAG: SO2930 family diheme c-type cytochrome [Kordiimonas sp.]
MLYALVGVLLFFTVPTHAEVNEAALMQKRPAKLLSAYGLFDNPKQQTPTASVLPFAIKVPLFTDYAHKYRFVYIPNGASARFDPEEAFDFPIGSVLVKTFAYPADFRKPEENIRLIETRLLIHQEKGWNAWAYVWNDEQTDAVLKVAGKTIPVDWIDETGVRQKIDYVVPNKNQCKGCHTFNKKFSPIGPKARNLNYEHSFPDGNKNQLEKWAEVGFLTGLPALDTVSSIPAFDDVSAPLDKRARAYLDINCAHCHRLEGPASTSGLFLTYGETNPTTWGHNKRPVAAGRGSGGLSYDIAPGKPEESILIYRLNSVDPGIMMPELGRTTIHAEGVVLLREWINQLK